MKSIKKLIVMCAAGCLALLTVACGGGDADAELQTLRMFRTIQTLRMFVPFRWGCPTRPSGCSTPRLRPLRMFHVVSLVWVCHPDPLGIRICCLQQHGSEPKWLNLCDMS
jgi:hypothetical protein